MQLLNDIDRYQSLSNNRKMTLLAFLTALSGFLSVIDAVIPKPLPFIKLGIANLITVLLIMRKQGGLALQTAFLRTLIAALIMGTLMSYTYLLSLGGAMLSVLGMWAAYRILNRRITEIGLSVIGAFFSVTAQGLIVMLFFGANGGIWLMISVMILIGLFNGILIGLIVRGLNRHLSSAVPCPSGNITDN